MIRYRGSALRTPTSSYTQGNIKRPTAISGIFCVKTVHIGMWRSW